MATKQDKLSFTKDAFTKNASKLPEFENHKNQTTKNTTCYMCACRCGIKVTLENKKYLMPKINNLNLRFLSIKLYYCLFLKIPHLKIQTFNT